jgi:hypothetical protein
MVRNVRDTQHGFGERPHYEPRELDREFEHLAVGFLKSRYGEPRFPFQTEDLKTFIEEHVHSLDQYADLSRFGTGVEGVTVFRPGAGKPKVAVAAYLQGNENRLRMTLAHEYGHVRLHAYLFELKARQATGLPPNHDPNGIYCKRDMIDSASKTDWLEWQASYAASALLAPATPVRGIVRPMLEKAGLFGPVAESTEDGAALIAAVAKAFAISQAAARVRLSVLGILGAPRAQGSLF